MGREKFLPHLRFLFVRPLLIGAAMSLIWWYVFREYGIHTHPEELSIGLAFAFFTVFHSLIANSTLSKVWKDYEKLRGFLENNDEEGFRKERYYRIPLAIKLLLLTLSFFIQAAAMYSYYADPLAGLVGSFSVAFVLVVFWEVAANLDDPVRGVWYHHKIPASWLEPPKEAAVPGA